MKLLADLKNKKTVEVEILKKDYINELEQCSIMNSKLLKEECLVELFTAKEGVYPYLMVHHFYIIK